MHKKVSRKTATSIVIANMVGTGVFTSLGFQLVGTSNTWSIVLLWTLGALMAVSGALSYAELGTKMTRSGGEYHYLSQVYGNHVGFLSGWCSLIVGFSAPIALASVAAGAYMKSYLGINEQVFASFLVIVVAFFHMSNLEKSSNFQVYTTALKVFLILLIAIVGISIPSQEAGFDWSDSWQEEIILPSFAVSLVYVSYAYSGWNAASYVVEEIDNPKVNLPKALIGGTLFVSVLYVAIQLVFLKHAPIEVIMGKVEVGQVVANRIFGDIGGGVISFFISLMLISSISAMTWVGPRVTKVMAEDYQFLRPLGTTNEHNVPVRAVIFQTSIALLMVWTGSFEQIITYSGFVLQVFVALTVLSLFFIRKNNDFSGFTSPLFPIPQIIFLAISAWILVYLLIEKPMESLFGLGILAVGSIVYFFNKASFKQRTSA